MVISVTPMVCITLAFWLGRIGLTCSGGCCADANGAAQISANRIAKVKRQNRFREIIVVLLRIWNLAHYVSRSGCTASATVSTGSGTVGNLHLPGFHVGEGLLDPCSIHSIGLAARDCLLSHGNRLLLLTHGVGKVKFLPRVRKGLFPLDRLVHP